MLLFFHKKKEKYCRSEEAKAVEITVCMARQNSYNPTSPSAGIIQALYRSEEQHLRMTRQNSHNLISALTGIIQTLSQTLYW